MPGMFRVLSSMPQGDRHRLPHRFSDHKRAAYGLTRPLNLTSKSFGSPTRSTVSAGPAEALCVGVIGVVFRTLYSHYPSFRSIGIGNTLKSKMSIGIWTFSPTWVSDITNRITGAASFQVLGNLKGDQTKSGFFVDGRKKMIHNLIYNEP